MFWKKLRLHSYFTIVNKHMRLLSYSAIANRCFFIKMTKKTKMQEHPKWNWHTLQCFWKVAKLKKRNLIGMPRMVWPLSRFACYMQQNRHRVWYVKYNTRSTFWRSKFKNSMFFNGFFSLPRPKKWIWCRRDYNFLGKHRFAIVKYMGTFFRGSLVFLGARK